MRTVTHRPSFNLHPLGLLAAAFAAGGVCVSAAALVTFSRKGYGAATLLVVVAFASAGCAFGLAESRGVGRDRVRRFFEEGRVASGEPVELTGVLERAPEGAPDGVLLTLGVERWDFKGEARAASGRVEL